MIGFLVSSLTGARAVELFSKGVTIGISVIIACIKLAPRK